MSELWRKDVQLVCAIGSILIAITLILSILPKWALGVLLALMVFVGISTL